MVKFTKRTKPKENRTKYKKKVSMKECKCIDLEQGGGGGGGVLQ
jgi:hypothetical protein